MAIDSYTGATALAVAAAAPVGFGSRSGLKSSGFSLSELFWGFIPGSVGETSVFCILLGGALLLITRIASWQIMAGSVLGLFGMGWILNATATRTNLAYLSVPPEYHLLMGLLLLVLCLWQPILYLHRI